MDATQVSATSEKLEPPSFENIDCSPERMGLELEDFLEKLMNSRERVAQDSKRKNKARGLMASWLRASYPFALMFLAVAKEGSSVFASV
jgi:hypothetical protein